MELMRAARLHGSNDLRVEDVPVPDATQCKEGVLVEVEWCGICGSDLHLYTSDAPKFQQPFMMGHEFCGVVRKAFPGSTLEEGDRVVTNPTLTCEECFCCWSGWEPQCPKLLFIGLPGGHGGGLSEFVTVQESKLHKIPDNIGFESAALVEPLAVGLHAVRKAEVDDKDWGRKTVLILGGGPVGYAVLANLMAAGADPGRLLVTEPTERRLKSLQSFGVRVLSPDKDDIVKACKELSQGEGVEVAFDCAGKTESAGTAMSAMRPRGTYINVAFWGSNLIVPFYDFFKKEVTCRSSMAYSGDEFREALDLMAQGKYRSIGNMVTARYPLENAQEAFHQLLTRREDHIKILVTPKVSNTTPVAA
ncbi:chaperonin 10-like protein [Aspergillus cavernicola]|uniref:Chaperonin 10-like protein n=1 Tax=Aspergillus cavernicola TaxID=176166 RepID=A0ABR4I9I0_9EURO